MDIYQSVDMTFKMEDSEVFVKDKTDWIRVDDQSMLMDQMVEDCDFCDWMDDCRGDLREE